jgi:hypothetical protein
MKSISESDEYKKRIAYPDRVECVLPEYNIIQYSKFHFLKLAFEINPFQSDNFFWLDAGASRFFDNMDISKSFPSETGIQIINQSKDKFICQCRADMDYYLFDDEFLWKADNMIYGGMFGGTKKVIDFIFFHLDGVFLNIMLKQGNMNNEQLALTIIFLNFPDSFSIYKIMMNEPILLLKLLSI